MRPIVPAALLRAALAMAIAAIVAITAAASLIHAQAPQTPSWIQNDKGEQSSIIDMQAAWNAAGGGLNFNGYANGEARLVVPAGWKVLVKFFNSSIDLAHSLVITKPYEAGKFPIEAGPGETAIPRAYTKSPVTGVYNDGDDFSFTASESRAGDYYLFCGVSTHGVAGMWIHLSVRPGVDAPHLIVEKAPAKPGRP